MKTYEPTEFDYFEVYQSRKEALETLKMVLDGDYCEEDQLTFVSFKDENLCEKNICIEDASDEEKNEIWRNRSRLNFFCLESGWGSAIYGGCIYQDREVYDCFKADDDFNVCPEGLKLSNRIGKTSIYLNA